MKTNTMIRPYHFLILCLAFLFNPTANYSQTFTPVAVTGFDADGIAEIPTNSLTCTSAAMDNSMLVMYSAAFAAGAGIGGGIINSGTIVSGTRTYQLRPFNVPNVLFDTNGTTKTMTVTTPAAFTKISLLCFSTELNSTVTIILRFTDGTVVNSGTFTIQDWYNGTGNVYAGFGRCPRAANASTSVGNPTNPMMYPLDINIPCADQQKLLSTITFINSGGAFAYTKACFLALSAVPYAYNVTTSHTDVNCFGASTGTATVTVVGNSTPYTYLWNSAPMQTSSVATGLAAGSYVVTITDPNGCTSTTNVTLTQPATAIAASITAHVDITCSTQGSITSSASGGTGAITYSWNSTPVQTTAAATSLSAGTFTVTATDANGCTATASYTLTAASGITCSITAQTNIPCFGGNSGAATVTANGGGGYLYNWNTTPVQNTATANTLVAGTYVVTVTDNTGCTSTTSVTITEPAQLTASITTQNNVLCHGGNTGNATVTANGGTTAYAYNWNTTPVQTTAAATSLTVGTYNVTITDANNCTATTTVTITEPATFNAVISATTSVSACNGNNGSATVTITGGTGAATYSWNTVPVQTTQTASNLPVGSYAVTCTDANGCTATTTVMITQPGMMSLTTSANVTICAGQSASIQVTVAGGAAPYSYVWAPGGATNSSLNVSPNATTNYIVTVTDAAGCVIVAPAITVIVSNAPAVSFTPSVRRGCTPLSVDFIDNSTVAGGDSIVLWSWAFGDGNTSLNQNPTDVYKHGGSFTVTLTCISSSGCSASLVATDLITTYTTPFANFIADPYETTLLNPEISFNNLSLYETFSSWNFGDGLGSYSNEQNPFYKYTNTGVYKVTLTVANDFGCRDSMTKIIIIDDDFEFFIPSSFTPNGNKLNDVFTGTGTNVSEFYLYIFNRWGETIYSTSDIVSGWNGRLDNTTDAPQGVYGYYIKVYDFTGTSHEYRGKVALIR